MIYRILCISLLVVLMSCSKDEFQRQQSADDFFFLRHEGADMPVWVEGNTNSNVFILLLHGGPGGSAFLINELIKPFTDPLEEAYGMVYWEQRSAGAAQGQFSEDKMRPEQFVEDLERLIFLLKDKYGQDIQLFLAGVSWGGYLGSSYLAKDANQNEITGWINIVGPHDFKAIGNLGRDKLLFYADQQIAFQKNTAAWTEIRDWCNEHEQIQSRADFEQVNRYANRADFLMEDSLIIETGIASIGEQLALVFSSPYDANAALSNINGVFSSDIIDILLEENLREQLPNIELPSLFITGRFDFVVPAENVQEQYDLIQSAEKEIHILQRSGHGSIAQETQKSVSLIINFVEKYR